jgi:hypothetical protein
MDTLVMTRKIFFKYKFNILTNNRYILDTLACLAYYPSFKKFKKIEL